MKKCKNIPSIAITSNNMSIIAKESNMILDLGIGIEQVGFVTKGFSATVLNLFLLAIILAKEKKLISTNQKEVYLKELNIIIENIPQVILKTENFIKEKKEIFLNAKRSTVSIPVFEAIEKATPSIPPVTTSGGIEPPIENEPIKASSKVAPIIRPAFISPITNPVNKPVTIGLDIKLVPKANSLCATKKKKCISPNNSACNITTSLFI